MGNIAGALFLNTALCAAFCACLAADHRRRRGGRAREAGRQLRSSDRAAAETTTHAAAAPVTQTRAPLLPRARALLSNRSHTLHVPQKTADVW